MLASEEALEGVAFLPVDDLSTLRNLFPDGRLPGPAPQAMTRPTAWAPEPMYPGVRPEPTTWDSGTAGRQARRIYEYVATEFGRRRIETQ